jgi:Flp pilus assembly protein TadD
MGAGRNARPFFRALPFFWRLDRKRPLEPNWPVIDEQLKLAAAVSRAALADGTADGHDHMILALESAAGEDHAAAQQYFDRALALEPGNPAILTGVANWYRHLGRLREAALACDAAIRLAPDYADAWVERGAVLGVGGSSKAARESYETAAKLDPCNAVALAGLAGQAARDGDMAAARTAGEGALLLDPSNLSAAAALALALLHDGDAQSARDLLDGRVAAAPSGHARSVAAHALGRAEEKLGNAERAFTAYALCKSDFAAANAAAATDQLAHTAFVEAIRAGVEAADPALWQNVESDQTAGAITPHVFLLGYPRSGTTLVENILASLHGVGALEEWPTLAETDQRYLSGNAAAITSGITEFGRLGCDARMLLRRAYWDKAAVAGIAPTSTAFVDMDPLKGTRLPFIAGLFPDARILVMRRDPRDVVWSCFKTNFGMTSNTLEYTSLERTARHYDALMRLTDVALAKLPIDAMDVDYRALIRDLDGVTQRICAFTGIEWTPEVRLFDKTAQTRGVGTASSAQVRKGLYDGSGQWKPFARWLEPVLPILAPWIERYGDD